MGVENGEMPRGLELIPGVAVRDFLGREVLEMDRLAVALLSNTTTSPSTIAGTLPLGLTLRKSARNWSPVRVSMGMGSYAMPASSRNRATLVGFGEPLK